jgi:DNA-binding MarR family transcriptional regulator
VPDVSTNSRTGEELLAVTTRLRRVLRRRLRAGATEPSLHGAQLELLRLVETAPGTGVASAARALHLAGNSVSTLVNQLVALRLLSRTADPVDRRAARLELTPAAHERLARWRQARIELVGTALDRLPETDRQAVAAALPALGRLLTGLEEAS